ncbi:MAG TPA: SpoIIE family protein phosphatase [Frankiaceae bacterium]|nr:SpoIIE family protein phosphatase [Frankiaceae bacterium]
MSEHAAPPSSLDDAEQLYDQAPCGYLSTTPDGLIVRVNQTFLDLTGFRREDLLDRRSFADILSAGGRIYHETHYAPMLQMQGSARGIALDLVRPDGRRVPVLINSVLERDEAGAPRTVRIAVFDATERREYERELLRAKQRAEESEARATAMARALQRVLIPPAPPRIPGLDVAAGYRPAGSGDEVGGDFYDFFPIAAGDWIVVLGDVSGKGVEAAIVTSLARHTIREAAVRLVDPSEVLRELSDVLLGHETGRFCTAVLLRLRMQDGGCSVSVSSGGHPLPLLVRANGDIAEVGASGSLLGAIRAVELRNGTVSLAAGDAIVLYTDGVTEGRRGKEFYGEERLLAAVRRGREAAATLVDAVLDDVLTFQAQDARDDIAVVVLRVPDGG